MPIAPTVEHAVVIAGAGPTGLMLAGELALAGVNVAIVERRATQDLAGLRAGGLQMRTLEVLDQLGIADCFIAEGQPFPSAPFADILLPIGDLPTRHSYFLLLWQVHIERILAEWAAELGVPVYRGREVADFTQCDTGVAVELSDGSHLHAEYLVGCDGGRSAVRRRAGIAFPGWNPSVSYLIAEVKTGREPEWGVRRSPQGINAVAKMEDGQRARIVVNEPQIRSGGQPPTLDDFRAALTTVYGTDFGLRSANYISRFSDATRQAASYRQGRVLLAGDAAHVHSPVGGQGLNLGIQDAVNLGWKLAAVVHGTSPDSLLDSYHAERHPVGARVLRNTMALTAIHRGEDRIQALRETMSELLGAEQTRKQYVAMMSGLDIRYGLENGHPLVGRRMPDLDLVSARGPLRLFSLLHKARPVLLNLAGPNAFDITPWADRVPIFQPQPVRASHWELPVIGLVDVPASVLIRPDGYVAWAGSSQTGLVDALVTWFGPPRPQTAPAQTPAAHSS